MTLIISTLIADTKLKQDVSPLEIASITVVVNFNDGQGKTYFGGQVTLTAEDDDISFQTTTEDLQNLAISKAKRLIAEAKLFIPEPEDVPDEPTQSEATTANTPVSEATSEAPVEDTPASEVTSEAPQSEATSEAE